VEDLTVLQSPWVCTPIYVKVGDELQYKYVIGRKDLQGRAQCGRFKQDDKCAIFDTQDKCKISMINSEVIAPYSCKPEDSQSSLDTCKQLQHGLFQCRKTSENEYIGVRKNEVDNIECLGRSPQTCAKFPTALACNKGIEEIKNDRYLECGRMMYELYGTTGYSDPESYCAKFRDVVN
jgi:hypothetical protein